MARFAAVIMSKTGHPLSQDLVFMTHNLKDFKRARRSTWHATMSPNNHCRILNTVLVLLCMISMTSMLPDRFNHDNHSDCHSRMECHNYIDIIQQAQCSLIQSVSLSLSLRVFVEAATPSFVNLISNRNCTSSGSDGTPSGWFHNRQTTYRCETIDTNHYPSPPSGVTTMFAGKDSTDPEVCQTIDLAAYSASIAQGVQYAQIGMWHARYMPQKDVPAVTARLLSNGGAVTEQMVQSGRLMNPSSGWMPTAMKFRIHPAATEAHICVSCLRYDRYSHCGAMITQVSFAIAPASPSGLDCALDSFARPFEQLFNHGTPLSSTQTITSTSYLVPQTTCAATASTYGLWHSFEGFGQTVKVSACQDITATTSHDIRLSVFTDRNDPSMQCTSNIPLSCINQPMYITTNGNSTRCVSTYLHTQWQEYQVLVSTNSSVGVQQSVPFTLSIGIASNPHAIAPAPDTELIINGDSSTPTLHSGHIPGWISDEIGPLCDWVQTFEGGYQSAPAFFRPLWQFSQSACAMYQDIDLAPWSSNIDTGTLRMKLAAYVRGTNQNDDPIGVKLTFYDGVAAHPIRSALRRKFVTVANEQEWPNSDSWVAQQPIQSASSGYGNVIGAPWTPGVLNPRSNAWFPYGRTVVVPPGARYARVRVESYRYNRYSAHLNGYVDDISLKVMEHGNGRLCTTPAPLSVYPSAGVQRRNETWTTVLPVSPSFVRACGAAKYVVGWYVVQGTGHVVNISIEAEGDWPTGAKLNATLVETTCQPSPAPTTCITSLISGANGIQLESPLYRDSIIAVTTNVQISPPHSLAFRMTVTPSDPAATSTFGTNLVRNSNAGSSSFVNGVFPGWFSSPQWDCQSLGYYADCTWQLVGDKTFFWTGKQKVAELLQKIDLSAFASDIDRGVQSFDVSVAMARYRYQATTIRAVIEFRDVRAKLLDFAVSDAYQGSSYTTWSTAALAPTHTRELWFRLVAYAHGVEVNDAYFKQVSVEAKQFPGHATCTTASSFDIGQDASADTSNPGYTKPQTSVCLGNGRVATGARWFSIDIPASAPLAASLCATNPAALTGMRLAVVTGNGCDSLTCVVMSSAQVVLPDCASSASIAASALRFDAVGPATYYLVAFFDDDAKSAHYTLHPGGEIKVRMLSVANTASSSTTNLISNRNCTSSGSDGTPSGWFHNRQTTYRCETIDTNHYPSPPSGVTTMFAGKGSTDPEVCQTIDLAAYSASIAQGVQYAQIGMWHARYMPQKDVPAMTARLLSNGGAVTEQMVQSGRLMNPSSGWMPTAMKFRIHPAATEAHICVSCLRYYWDSHCGAMITQVSFELMSAFTQGSHCGVDAKMHDFYDLHTSLDMKTSTGSISSSSYVVPTSKCSAAALSNGIWHSFEGVGQTVKVSACQDITATTSHDIRLSVFTGRGDPQEQCISHIPLTCVNQQLSVTMQGNNTQCVSTYIRTNRQEYQVLVSTNSSVSTQQYVPFTLTIGIASNPHAIAPAPNTELLVNGDSKTPAMYNGHIPGWITDELAPLCDYVQTFQGGEHSSPTFFRPIWQFGKTACAMYQDVDLAPWAMNIDSGTLRMKVSAYLFAAGSANDDVGLKLTFYDGIAAHPIRSALHRKFVTVASEEEWPKSDSWVAQQPIQSASSGYGNVIGASWSPGIPKFPGGSWLHYGHTLVVPPGARYARVRVEMYRTYWDSPNNDGYVDDVSLKVAQRGNARLCTTPAPLSVYPSTGVQRRNETWNTMLPVTPSFMRACGAADYQVGWYVVQGTGHIVDVLVEAEGVWPVDAILNATLVDTTCLPSPSPTTCIASLSDTIPARVDSQLYRDFIISVTTNVQISPPQSLAFRMTVTRAAPVREFETNLVRNSNAGTSSYVNGIFPGWWSAPEWDCSSRGFSSDCTWKLPNDNSFFWTGSQKIGELMQKVDVSGFETDVDRGVQSFDIGASMARYWDNGGGTMRAVVEFRDEHEKLLNFVAADAYTDSSWSGWSDTVLAPRRTREMWFRLIAYGDGHVENNAYFRQVNVMAKRLSDSATCDSAQAIVANMPSDFDNSDATYRFPQQISCLDSSDNSVATRTIWFSQVPSLDTQLSASVCSSNPPAVAGLRVAVMSGSGCGQLQCVAISNRGASVPSCNANDQYSALSVHFPAIGGVTYFVAVFFEEDNAALQQLLQLHQVSSTSSSISADVLTVQSNGGPFQLNVQYRCTGNWNADCTACLSGFYGPGCAKSCSACSSTCDDGVNGSGACYCSDIVGSGCNNASRCDNSTGLYTGRWDTSQDCVDCTERAFGSTCAQTCSSCLFSCADGLGGNGTCNCADPLTCAAHGICSVARGECICVDEYFSGVSCTDDAKPSAIAATICLSIYLLLLFIVSSSAIVRATGGWRRTLAQILESVERHENVPGTEKRVLKLNTANGIASFAMIWFVLQLCSFSFHRTIPWHKAAEPMANTARFAVFDYVDNVYTIFFSISVFLAVSFCIVCAVFLLASNRQSFNVEQSSSGCHLFFAFAQLIVVSVAIWWVAIVRTMMQAVDCTYSTPGRKPFMDANEDTTCWSSEHAKFVVPFFLFFSAFIPVTFRVIPRMKQMFSGKLQLRSLWQFHLISMMCVLLMCAASVFVGSSPTVYLLVLFVVTTILLVANVLMSPVRDTDQYVYTAANRWRSIGFFIAVWCSLCALAASVIDDAENVVPAVLLFLGSVGVLLVGVLVQVGLLKSPVNWAARFRDVVHDRIRASTIGSKHKPSYYDAQKPSSVVTEGEPQSWNDSMVSKGSEDSKAAAAAACELSTLQRSITSFQRVHHLGATEVAHIEPSSSSSQLALNLVQDASYSSSAANSSNTMSADVASIEEGPGGDCVTSSDTVAEAARAKPKLKPKPPAPAPPTAPKPALPPGWTEYVTDDTHLPYYHNETTNETVWERPTK
jgi:WW domain